MARSSSAPTRREVFIVCVLLFSVLFFSNPRSGSSPPSPTPHNASLPQAQSRLTWKHTVPQTTVIAHAPGWTLFERLYVMNGVVYVVSDEPEKIPDVSHIYSKAHFIELGEEAEAMRLPTDEDIRVVRSAQARAILGTEANIIDGVNFLVNDPPQYINHYYHFCAELLYGLWRTYSSLDPYIPSNGTTSLPPPKRLIFNRFPANYWRDYTGMNQLVLRSAFPSVSLEFIDDWQDRIQMGTAFVFDRVLVADRSASMLGYNYARYQRTAAVASALPGSVHWWNPIRRNVVALNGADPDAWDGTTSRPVITYISRQPWKRRILIEEHHARLVQGLYDLRDKYGYEVNVVEMEKLTRSEQIRLAARTTILMGVHGNGLTSLLWMKPSPRATVMEFFYPEGFAHDYEFTTRALGMTHYGFWNDQYFTSPGLPLPKYVDGFQGDQIPIDADVVTRLCHERLSLAAEVDD